MIDPKVSEDKFRSNLLDVAVVIQKLSTICKSPEEMLGIIQLALDGNDGQLRILLNIVGAK